VRTPREKSIGFGKYPGFSLILKSTDVINHKSLMNINVIIAAKVPTKYIHIVIGLFNERKGTLYLYPKFEIILRASL